MMRKKRKFLERKSNSKPYWCREATTAMKETCMYIKQQGVEFIKKATAVKHRQKTESDKPREACYKGQRGKNIVCAMTCEIQKYVCGTQ